MKAKNIILIFLSIPLLLACPKADDEYVHDSNIISQMFCRGSHSVNPIYGRIYEYDKNGDLVTLDFEQEDVEGGYGIIVFTVSSALRNDIDLKNVYLVASLTWDQFITPSLSGRHDITGDGFIITVTSGVGTTRHYRIRGFFD